METRKKNHVPLLLAFVALGIALAALVCSCVLFVPRSLASLVATDQIEAMYYVQLTAEGPHRTDLTAEQRENIARAIRQVQYVPQYRAVKTKNIVSLYIEYTDGSVTEIQSTYIATTKEGQTKVRNLRLKKDAALYAYYKPIAIE